MPTLEVRHLAIIDGIARAGTITAAAGRLHITQPGLSHALGELEHRLGVRLFRRERRRMVPTREGERLLQTARTVLADVERAEQDLAQYRGGVRGVLRLSTECYTCYHWLPPLIRRFGARYPDVRVHLVPEATRYPFRALRAHTLDLAITHSPREGQELADRRLFEDELVAVVPPTHRLARRRVLHPRDFAAETLVLHTEPEQSHLVTEVLDPVGVRAARTLVLPLTEAILEVVKAGMGISVLAAWAVAREVSRGTLRTVRIGRAGLHRTWRATYRREDVDHPALTSLVALLCRETLAGAAIPTGRPGRRNDARKP